MALTVSLTLSRLLSYLPRQPWNANVFVTQAGGERGGARGVVEGGGHAQRQWLR